MQSQMNVCQTCGAEGYSKLLIHCDVCQLVAVHRYCVDGPTNIDDDEVSWSCEECVPRVPQPVQAFRKSERICSILDREALRRKARRNWKNHSSVPKVGNLNCVGKGASKAAGDASDLDEKKNGIVKRKQGKLKENGAVTKKGGSEPALQIRQKKKVLNSDGGASKESLRPLVLGLKCNIDGEDLQKKLAKKKKVLNSDDGSSRKSLEPSLVLGLECQDLNNFNIDGEDLQEKLENNLGPELPDELDHRLENTSKANEISDGDSVAEKWHNNGQSFSDLHSSLLDKQQGIGSSEAAKQPDGEEDMISDYIEETNVVSASHQRGDKQSGCSVYKCQTPRKKRRLVISMEYTDCDEEPVYVKDELPQVVPDQQQGILNTSSGEPPVKKGLYDFAQESCMKSDDYFPTRPSPMQPDNHMLTQTSSVDFDNHVIPRPSPVMFVHYVPAQPVINAVWRGHCSITNHMPPMSFGLEAHLSNKAHANVHGAASALPDLLDFEIMRKHDAWPKRFEESPPTSDAIGLYLFPVEERDEKWYMYLLDEMIECDLVLKSQINNLELLAFCSQELPREEWRFQTKYYLWGVFMRKQETSLTSRPSDIHISDAMYHKRDLAIPGTSRSSVSPSSVQTYSLTNSSNSHLRGKAENHVKLTPIIISKHHNPAYTEQGCSSQPNSSGGDSLARRNDHQTSRKFCKPQEHAYGIGDAKYSYHERGSNLYKEKHGTKHDKPMNKWRDAPLRRSSHSRSSYRSVRY